MIQARWLATIVVIAFVGLVWVVQSNQQQVSLQILRVGVLPDEDSNIIRTRYTPLLEYLSKETGINTELILPANYQELVRLFNEGKIELAYLGGLTFIQAHVLNDAQPLVMREIDTRFTSWFITKNRDRDRDRDRMDSISEFKNHTFAFGNKLSTSGHLMPRYFMQTQMQLSAEKYFSKVQHTRTHDETAYLVRDGIVDLGVANSQIIKKMLLDGRLNENDIHIVWETPPYTDYVWATQNYVSETTKMKLRDAFLRLNGQNIEQEKILTSLTTKHFIPAGINDFQLLKKIADKLDLIK